MANSSKISSYLEDFDSIVSNNDAAAKVAKNFWREGRQHGKKCIPWDAMRETIIAVLVRHGGSLEEKFSETKQAKVNQILELQNQREVIEEQLSEMPEPPSREEFVQGEGLAESESALGMSSQPSRNDQKDLNRAHRALKEHRKRTEILEAERRWQADVERIQLERRNARNKISELQSKVDVLNNQLVELPETYRSKWKQSVEVSEFIWARFVDGCNQGKSKIRVPFRLTKSGKALAKEKYDMKMSHLCPAPELQIEEIPTFG